MQESVSAVGWGGVAARRTAKSTYLGELVFTKTRDVDVAGHGVDGVNKLGRADNSDGASVNQSVAEILENLFLGLARRNESELSQRTF